MAELEVLYNCSIPSFWSFGEHFIIGKLYTTILNFTFSPLHQIRN